MSELLCVGLDGWIIQDENYDNFRCGDQAAFALEFYAHEPLAAIDPAITPTLLPLQGEGSRYRATCKVIHLAHEWWAIDAGFVAYSPHKPPPNVKLGDWMAGDVYIGVDPFFYFTQFRREIDAPAMIYDWRIEKIEIDTAPFIEVRPKHWQRDPTRRGWREVLATDAWHDDGGNANYTLHCRQVSEIPRRSLKPWAL